MKLSFLALGALLLAAAPAPATIYQIERTVGTRGTVTGFITTSVVGELLEEDIVDWELRVRVADLGGFFTLSLDPSSSVLRVTLADDGSSRLSANGHELLFDFTNPPGSAGGDFSITSPSPGGLLGRSGWLLNQRVTGMLPNEALLVFVPDPGPVFGSTVVASADQSGSQVIGRVPEPAVSALLALALLALATRLPRPLPSSG